MIDQKLKASVIVSYVGLHPILVHGGGSEINSWLKQINIEPLLHESLSVIDAKTMEIHNGNPLISSAWCLEEILVTRNVESLRKLNRKLLVI
ncbi:unnamed protein product [Linum trigynum]